MGDSPMSLMLKKIEKNFKRGVYLPYEFHLFLH